MKKGQIIKEIRLRAGLSMEEFAEKIGSNKTTICNYENNKHSPNFKNARKIIAIAKELDLPYYVFDLLNNDYKPEV